MTYVPNESWRSVEVYELHEDLARAIHEQHFTGDAMPTCGFPARPGLCSEASAAASTVLDGWPESVLHTPTGAGAHAEHDAEVLRAAALDWEDDGLFDPTGDGTPRWLRERADRIERQEAPPPCQTGSDGASRPERGQP